jgi:hypothetical protein
MLISWALSKEQQIYMAALSPPPRRAFAAQDCRAFIARDLIPINPTQ